VIHDRIQSKSNLEVKKIVDDAGCEVCNDGEETAQHILFDCPFTCSFWAAWAFVRQQDSVPSNCTSCLALTAVTGCRLNTTTAWSSSVAGNYAKGETEQYSATSYYRCDNCYGSVKRTRPSSVAGCREPARASPTNGASC
jgi:hypothetical protein